MLQDDAVYPYTLVDSTGAKLTGANKFTLTFAKGQTPPVNGFWSITLYFQQESPSKDKESNWLPAPAGEFIPMLRMYWPKNTSPSILNATWTPPMINNVP